MLKPPPVMTASQPQAQVVTVHTLPQQKSSQLPYHTNSSKVLGGLQLLGGILAIIFGGLLLWSCSIAGVTGAGIWCGIFYVITGVFGLYAGKHQTRGYITAYMVLCMLTVLLGCGVIISCAVALALSDSVTSNYCVNYGGFSTRGTVFECLLLIIGIIELITLMWGAVISSQVVCGCGHPPPPSPNKARKEAAANVEYSESKSMVVIGSKDQPVQNVSMLSDEPPQHPPGQYPQDTSQQGYYPHNTSQQQQGYYSQDTSQQGYYPQDTSQQGYYPQDNSQQGYYPQDPNQQGYYDPNQQQQGQPGYYDPNQGYYDQQGNYYAPNSSYDQQQQQQVAPCMWREVEYGPAHLTLAVLSALLVTALLVGGLFIKRSLVRRSRAKRARAAKAGVDVTAEEYGVFA